MIMKKIWMGCMILFLVFCGCTPARQEAVEKATSMPEELPKKDASTSVLMSESPLNPENIDDYLFREDCIYIDTRDPNQFLKEGFIAGFRNLPFYECLVSVQKEGSGLFWMTKIKAEEGQEEINLGDVGSFIPKYEESQELIEALFPKDKNILIISTAGVESTYLMNLLLQLGYDGDQLYNVGSFSNSLGTVAYRDRKEARYYVEGTDVYQLTESYDWGELTPLPIE